MTRDKGGVGVWRSHGLIIVLLGLFALMIVGQALTGWRVYNSDQREHGEEQAGFVSYLGTPHFWETTSENWESEFLQMLALVALTVFLRERGSPESDEPELPPGKEKSPNNVIPFIPRWRRAGFGRLLYEHSLSIALASLFLFSFGVHVVSGAYKYDNEQRAHGDTSVSVPGYLATPEMWFESLQNWQSEFLSSGLLVLLTVYLREKGSSESKPVDAAHESNEA